MPVRSGRGMPFIIGPREEHRRAGFPKAPPGSKPPWQYLGSTHSKTRPLVKHPKPRKR